MKPGQMTMVRTGEVVVERENGSQHTVALMQATTMVVRDRPGVLDYRDPTWQDHCLSQTGLFAPRLPLRSQSRPRTLRALSHQAM